MVIDGREVYYADPLASEGLNQEIEIGSVIIHQHQVHILSCRPIWSEIWLIITTINWCVNREVVFIHASHT